MSDPVDPGPTAPPDLAGPRLTTHVLDVSRGLPAAGVAVVLARIGPHGSSTVATTTTNADGRTDAPLLAGGDLLPGRYQLEYAVGAYFATTAGPPSGAEPPAETPFLDVVPVRFGVAPGTGHLHVALLVTPWSYTTYRGS